MRNPRKKSKSKKQKDPYNLPEDENDEYMKKLEAQGIGYKKGKRRHGESDL